MTVHDTIEWRDMILINSWARKHATNYITPQYAKDSNGFVHFRGSMAGGTSASHDFTVLPPGFRPPKDIICAAAHDGGQRSVQVEDDGTCSIVNGGDTGQQELDGVSFFAWQSPPISGGGGGRSSDLDPGEGGPAPG